MTEKIMVVASKNRKKAVEMMELLKGLGWRVLSMVEAGVDIEIEEDGLTFEENSYKKAFQVMKATGKTAIADDSGLEVYALGGRPGVFSARFSGDCCKKFPRTGGEPGLYAQRRWCSPTGLILP